MIRLVIGALVASVVLFLYGFFFWVYLSDKLAIMHGLPKEAESAVATLQGVIKEDGHYFYPWLPKAGAADEEQALKEFTEKHKQGPLVQVVYSKAGADPMDPKAMGLGFAHYFVCALIAGSLLGMAGLTSFVMRVLFVFGLGVFGAIFVHLGTIIWMHSPTQLPIYSTIYGASSWLLAGLVLAFFVKPKPKAV